MMQAARLSAGHEMTILDITRAPKMVQKSACQAGKGHIVTKVKATLIKLLNDLTLT